MTERQPKPTDAGCIRIVHRCRRKQMVRELALLVEEVEAIQDCGDDVVFDSLFHACLALKSALKEIQESIDAKNP